MLVIDPSYEIQDELDWCDPVVRIEHCGRICYKSEDQITPESAAPFVQKIIKHGHNSVTEMAACTLRLTLAEELVAGFFRSEPRYLQIDREPGGLLVTGTVRAFREQCLFHPEEPVSLAMAAFLRSRQPVLYADLPATGAGQEVGVAKLELAEVEKLPPERLARHRYLGVKFIINRAVTHEIVRHRPCSFLQESQRYCRYSQDKFSNQVSFIRPMFFKEHSEEMALWRRAMEETEQIYLKLLETVSPQAARTVLPNSCKTELIVYANLVEWHHIFRLRTTPAAEPSMREVMIPLCRDLQGRYPAVFGDIALA